MFCGVPLKHASKANMRPEHRSAVDQFWSWTHTEPEYRVDPVAILESPGITASRVVNTEWRRYRDDLRSVVSSYLAHAEDTRRIAKLMLEINRLMLAGIESQAVYAILLNKGGNPVDQGVRYIWIGLIKVHQCYSRGREPAAHSSAVNLFRAEGR